MIDAARRWITVEWFPGMCKVHCSPSQTRDAVSVARAIGCAGISVSVVKHLPNGMAEELPITVGGGDESVR